MDRAFDSATSGREPMDGTNLHQSKKIHETTIYGEKNTFSTLKREFFSCEVCSINQFYINR